MNTFQKLGLSVLSFVFFANCGAMDPKEDVGFEVSSETVLDESFESEGECSQGEGEDFEEAEALERLRILSKKAEIMRRLEQFHDEKIIMLRLKNGAIVGGQVAIPGEVVDFLLEVRNLPRIREGMGWSISTEEHPGGVLVSIPLDEIEEVLSGFERLESEWNPRASLWDQPILGRTVQVSLPGGEKLLGVVGDKSSKAIVLFELFPEQDSLAYVPIDKLVSMRVIKKVQIEGEAEESVVVKPKGLALQARYNCSGQLQALPGKKVELFINGHDPCVGVIGTFFPRFVVLNNDGFEDLVCIEQIVAIKMERS